MLVLRTRESSTQLVAQLVVSNDFRICLLLLMGHVLTKACEIDRLV